MEFLRRFWRLPLLDRVLFAFGPAFVALGFGGVGWLGDLASWLQFAAGGVAVIWLGIAYVRWWRRPSVGADGGDDRRLFEWRDWLIPVIVIGICVVVIVVSVLAGSSVEQG